MLFSGKFLAHRQTVSESLKNNEGNVWLNFVAYGNEKLFNLLKKSFERNLNDE